MNHNEQFVTGPLNESKIDICNRKCESITAGNLYQVWQMNQSAQLLSTLRNESYQSRVPSTTNVFKKFSYKNKKIFILIRGAICYFQ